MKNYYIAYGSNMDEGQMARRCRDAELVGTGYIKDYELLFKGSQTGNYATIERKTGGIVPVTVWKISANDEKRLDHYEGVPRFYYKQELPVRMGRKTIHGLVYIMHENREYGMPYDWYYLQMEQDYHKFGFDIRILRKALSVSQQRRKGIRVRLIAMDDKQAPPKGTEGTVQFVDDAGTIHVQWDTGSSLGLVPGADEWEIIE